MGFDDLFRLRQNALSDFSVGEQAQSQNQKDMRKSVFREPSAWFKLGGIEKSLEKSNFNMNKTQDNTMVSALIQKNRTDKENEFIFLEHTLSVLYIPTKAIRKFLNQSTERNELLYHRMYNGTMAHSLNIRLLRHIKGNMLRVVRERVDLGITRLNKQLMRKMKDAK